MAYDIPPSEKVGGHVARVPHEIAPMFSSNHKINHFAMMIVSLLVAAIFIRINNH